MANLTHNSTSWSGENTQTTQSKTYTFSTGGTYADKDIQFTVTSKTGVVESTSGNVSGSNVSLSTSNTSGISITGSGKGVVTSSGWVEAGDDISASSQTKYITAVTLPNSKTFQINDGIYNWTWTKDSSGNVTII